MREKMTLTTVFLTISLIVISTLTLASTAMAEVAHPSSIFDSTISMNPRNGIVDHWHSQQQDWVNRYKEWFKRIPRPSRIPFLPSQPRPVPLPRIKPSPKPETLPAFPPYPQPIPLTL